MRRAGADQDRVFERRKIAALTELELLLKVAGEIVVPRKLNRRTNRRVSLHKNFARRFAAADAPGDLREKMERSFACSEIGQMQSQISVDDSDQRHVRKMQTFGDHLRAHQNVDLASAKIS